MIITTKTGDHGSTSLYTGERVEKDDMRIELNGEMDELNALLGLCKAQSGQQEPFETLQRQLTDVMTIVASNGKAEEGTLLALQQSIDKMEAHIAEVGRHRHFTFLLPGRSVADATLHLARAKARTCERRFVTLNRQMSFPEVIRIYLNRLSDYLFSLILEDVKAE